MGSSPKAPAIPHSTWHPVLGVEEGKTGAARAWGLRVPESWVCASPTPPLPRPAGPGSHQPNGGWCPGSSHEPDHWVLCHSGPGKPWALPAAPALCPFKSRPCSQAGRVACARATPSGPAHTRGSFRASWGHKLTRSNRGTEESPTPRRPRRPASAGPVCKWEAPSSLFREPSSCLGAVRIRVPGHTSAWPAHLAVRACQSSCSRKRTFSSHSAWIAAGAATGSREGLIIDGGGVQGHGPLKGSRALTWEAWAPLPDRVSAPQHHHRETSWRGSPGPGPGRRTPIFRECDQRPGRVRTPPRPRPHPTPALHSPPLQVPG